MSLLKQVTTRKKRVDEKHATELNASKDNGKYKVGTIYNNTVYTRKLESGYLLKLYYLVF